MILAYTLIATSWITTMITIIVSHRKFNKLFKTNETDIIKLYNVVTSLGDNYIETVNTCNTNFGIIGDLLSIREQMELYDDNSESSYEIEGNNKLIVNSNENFINFSSPLTSINGRKDNKDGLDNKE